MYTLERFGLITLPVYNTEYTISPVSAKLSLVETTAGAFDMDGSARNRQEFPFTLSYACLISEETLIANRVRLDALRAAVGTQATLYRRADDDFAVHSCVARLIKMPQVRPYGERGWYKFTLEFMQMGRWRGGSHDGWVLDEGILFDDGRELDETEYIFTLNPGTSETIFAIENGGNYPVRDAIITITAGSAAITDVDIFNASTGNCHIRFLGTIAAGTAVVINIGSLSVQNNGGNAYANLSRFTYHTSQHWFEIGGSVDGFGLNAIDVHKTGGGTGSTIRFSYRDGWA